jgi:hypothetical protein
MGSYRFQSYSYEDEFCEEGSTNDGTWLGFRTIQIKFEGFTLVINVLTKQFTLMKEFADKFSVLITIKKGFRPVQIRIPTRSFWWERTQTGSFWLERILTRSYLVRTDSDPFILVRTDYDQFILVRTDSGQFILVRTDSDPFILVRTDSDLFFLVRTD